MNYDAFLAKYPQGTVLNNYSGECVSLVANYLDFNGLHAYIAYANAKDWANVPVMRGAFDWTENKPSDPNQVPKRGDIIVWGGSLPGSGGYGHIAIWDRVVSPGVFSSYDNNWGGRYCHFVTHNWGYVLGWWTRKASAPAPTTGDKLMTAAEEANAYQIVLGRLQEGGATGRSGYQFIVDAKNEITVQREGTRTQIVNLTNTINSLNQQITQITGQTNATKAEKDAALAKVAELTTQLTEAMDKLKEAQAHPQIPPQNPDDIVVTRSRFNGLFDKIKALFKKG